MRSGYFDVGDQNGQWTIYDKSGAVYKVTNMKPKKRGEPQRSLIWAAEQNAQPETSQTPPMSEASTPRKTPDEVLPVVGGHADGLKASVSDLVDTSKEKYQVRTLSTSRGVLRLLALSTLSDFEVLLRYITPRDE